MLGKKEGIFPPFLLDYLFEYNFVYQINLLV